MSCYWILVPSVVWIPPLGQLLIPVSFADVVRLVALSVLFESLGLVSCVPGCLVDWGRVLVLLAWWVLRSVVLVVVFPFRLWSCCVVRVPAVEKLQ